MPEIAGAHDTGRSPRSHSHQPNSRSCRRRRGGDGEDLRHNQRARTHAESDEACRKRRGAAAPAGQGVVALQDVPHWAHLRVRRCNSLLRAKIVCLSSSSKI